MIDITHDDLCLRFKNKSSMHLKSKKFNWRKFKFDYFWLEDPNKHYYFLTKNLTLEIDYTFRTLACYFHLKDITYRMDNFTVEDLEYWICDPEELINQSSKN